MAKQQVSKPAIYQHIFMNSRAERVMRGFARYEHIYRNSDIFHKVHEKLQKKEYKNSAEFVSDVESAIRSAMGSNRLEGAFTDHAIKMFHKECRRQMLFSGCDWADEVMRLRNRIERLTLEAPPQVARHAGELVANIALKRPETLVKDMEAFIEAQKKLTDERDHKAMIKIILEMEPERKRDSLDEMSMSIDLTKLRLATFMKLKGYVKKALARQNLDF